MKYEDIKTELMDSIIKSYEEGVSLDEAERLASKLLFAQALISERLRTADLDSRMKKSGLKAAKAAVYADIISKSEKKPTESALEHALNADEIVTAAQDAFDTAEVDRDELERYYNIFKEAHVHFRRVAGGRFGD